MLTKIELKVLDNYQKGKKSSIGTGSMVACCDALDSLQGKGFLDENYFLTDKGKDYKINPLL